MRKVSAWKSTRPFPPAGPGPALWAGLSCRLLPGQRADRAPPPCQPLGPAPGTPRFVHSSPLR